MTKLRLTRTARGAVIAVVLALVVAAPAAAAQPTRSVIDWQPVSHFPAGTGCDFDVTAHNLPSAHTNVIEFSDGTLVYDAHSLHRRIVNDTTGARYDNSIVFHEVDRVDSAGIDHGTVNGQFVWQFYPGDMGPDGVILDHVLALDIVGRATYVVDWNTGVTLEFSMVGRYTDICAAIS
jgi:phage baseplate assembly protein gpV